ncbi:proline iminopeptidase [Lactarius akahatsu]|uniref:Proline iminopeptidase n=1 Tax=Lactarius akahatsu TaxID=416441 RepID=A0AAD4QF72_9AGAM|nr:proline iminopeptidase [Lactarius akahatsu]
MVYSYSAPFETGKLKVSNIHSLHYEVSGKKNGTPGGPGGGCDEKDRGFFNPEKYKVIFLDQRGAGKSTPSASLEENTTWDLVKDIERLREHLKVEKWHCLWGIMVLIFVYQGSTLSLAYAQSHPDRVKSLVLRELKWFYQEGASHLFPEAWQEYLAPIPESERGDLILAYHSRLNSADNETRLKAARAWSKWEMSTSKLYIDPAHVAAAEEDDWANAFARIENHYFVNDGFIREGQLLDRQEIDKIRHIPTIAVQGRYDVVCPAATAYALKQAWPEITLHVVPDAGHSSREPGTTKLLVEATDKFADL